MSLTSYRAAPSRATNIGRYDETKLCFARPNGRRTKLARIITPEGEENQHYKWAL
jgi:hypothetical protein